MSSCADSREGSSNDTLHADDDFADLTLKVAEGGLKIVNGLGERSGVADVEVIHSVYCSIIYTASSFLFCSAATEQVLEVISKNSVVHGLLPLRNATSTVENVLSASQAIDSRPFLPRILLAGAPAQPDYEGVSKKVSRTIEAYLCTRGGSAGGLCVKSPEA